MKLTRQAVEALKLYRKHQNEERLKAARWEDHDLFSLTALTIS